jgi:hypothetical protein
MSVVDGTEPTLGIRAQERHVYWAVISGTKAKPCVDATGQEDAPGTFDEAEALTFFRSRLILIIDQYKPVKVSVRYPERSPGANKSEAKARCRVEGVALEAASSRGKPVITGTFNSITKRLGSESAKSYLQSGDFRGVDLEEYPQYVQEAIMWACAALER